MLISRAFFGGPGGGGEGGCNTRLAYTDWSLIAASITNMYERDIEHSCSILPTLQRAGSTWCERTAANADRLEQDVD